MRRAARVDANQGVIVRALRKIGCSVQDLSKVGEGCCDILVGVLGLNLLMEIKDGEKPPSARKLTPAQQKWHASWRGQKAVVESVEDAVEIVNAIRGKI